MRIAVLACRLQGDGDAVREQAARALREGGLSFEEVETAPDALVFATGGTESDALPHVRDGTLLLPVGTANGLAAALEVRAWAAGRGWRTPVVPDLLERPTLVRTWNALAGLRGAPVGLLGAASPWLVASADCAALAALGVAIEALPLDQAWDRRREDADLLARVRARAGSVPRASLDEAVALAAGLRAVAAERGLRGLTVRCFDLLQERGVSACLGLALLNADGVVAACEGDLDALATMLVARALTGSGGFQANLARWADGVGTFAHCTVDLSLVGSYAFATHFESDRSVAVSAHLDAPSYSVFRVGSGRRFTLFTCGAAPHEPCAEMCRTQLSLRLPRRFFEVALGNHQVVLPGDHELELAALAELGWTRVA